jgi:hypothetical protein
MNKILISFALMTNICCISSEPFLKPLWEEDYHFCHYRTLCIEGSIYRIGELVKEARNNPENIENLLEYIEREVFSCKSSLYMPYD